MANKKDIETLRIIEHLIIENPNTHRKLTMLGYNDKKFVEEKLKNIERERKCMNG